MSEEDVKQIKKVMVSMPVELHKRVVRAAEENHRTFQDQLRYMVDTHKDMKEVQLPTY